LLSDITLESIPVKSGFEAYVLSVRGFPLDDEQLSPAQALVNDFCSAIRQRSRLSSEVFLQLEQLRGKECRNLVADCGKRWLPETGLGVWVDRPPPQKWTQEELENFVPGDKLRPIMFQVFRISTGQQFCNEAKSLMLRYGSVLEILTSAGDKYLQRVKPVFLEGIVDRSYTCFPYYVPLMEAKTLAGAESGQLDRWFQSMTVYIRESFEDSGILIASAQPLAEVFHDIGGKCEAGVWTFRVTAR
jgi:hypothetical protein